MRSLAGILALCLFVCMVYPCMGDTSREMVVVFKGGQTPVPYEDDKGDVIIKKPRAFRVPAFVGGMFNDKEFLAVLCDARYKGFSDWSFIEAAARTSYGDHSSWSAAEIFVKNSRRSLANSVVGDITAVMKENKIFVLAPSWDVSQKSWVHHPPSSGWNPLLIVGTVVNSTDSTTDSASITWENKGSLKHLRPTTINGAPASQFIGGVGNGVVMKNGAIVFPIQMANNRRQVSSSIMYSTDDGNTWIMGKPTPNGPSECSVVEWGEGKLLLTTRYDSGYRIVYESDDMGKTWKESLMFSQIWGNQPDRRDVGSQGTAITAPVDDKDVLLFSHPLNKKGRYARDTLQLWMSDGLRITCVGTISENGKGESSGYSILAQVGDNLYSLHEINPYGDWKKYDAPLKTWDRVIALSPLTHFYESVKNTVHAWRELDNQLQTNGVPINALVGYLSSSSSETVWADMYSCVDGTVKNGERVDGGFRFTAAPGSGAQWPVISQGQNQVYIFTRQQFTLTATVTIHNASGAEYVSLLGASGNAYGNAVLFGLGYTQDNKWYAIKNNGNKVHTDTVLVQNKEYHVGMTFENGVAFVYVDGTVITGGKLTLSRTASISHFFIGGMGKSSRETGGSCTVKNVMLFNRALSQEEITGLTNADHEGKQKEPISTTAPTTAQATEETLPATTSTSTPLKPETSSATTSTSAPVNDETVLTTKNTKAPRNRGSVSTSTSSIAPVKRETSATASTSAPASSGSLSATTSTSAPVNDETVLTTKNTKVLENDESASTTEPKEVSATVLQKVANGEGSGRKMNNSLHEYRDMASEKYAKGDNGSMESLSAVAWMCLVCSFAMLLGF